MLVAYDAGRMRIEHPFAIHQKMVLVMAVTHFHLG